MSADTNDGRAVPDAYSGLQQIQGTMSVPTTAFLAILYGRYRASQTHSLACNARRFHCMPGIHVGM